MREARKLPSKKNYSCFLIYNRSNNGIRDLTGLKE